MKKIILGIVFIAAAIVVVIGQKVVRPTPLGTPVPIATIQFCTYDHPVNGQGVASATQNILDQGCTNVSVVPAMPDVWLVYGIKIILN